jgi:Spy/CpxP family protein refolding chaperone
MRRTISATTAVAVASLALVLMVVGSDMASAQSPANRSRNRQWWTVQEVQSTLGLTSEQVSRIETLEQARAEQLQDLRQSEMKAIRELVQALDHPETSTEQIAAARARLEQSWMQHLQVSLDHWVSLREVLTTEQWQQLPSTAPRALQLGMLGLRARQQPRQSGPRD